MTATVPTPILYYDGTCGLCAQSVQFVLARDRRRALRFGPLQGESGRALVERVPALRGVDSVVWFDGEATLTRGDAVLAVLQYLGGGWRVLAVLGRVLPRPLRDLLYDVAARNRFRLVARACLLPTPGERARFVP